MVLRNSALHQRNTQEGVTTNAVLALATNLLGQIDWQPEQGFGYCRCPGASLHSNRTARRDTRVYLGTGAPTITCFHASCGGAVAEANRTLRSQIGRLERGATVSPVRYVQSVAQRAREQEQAEAVRLAAAARQALSAILDQYHWTPADIWTDSPASLDDTDTDWRRYLATLYAPDDVVWIGERYDSGQPRHAEHFRPAVQWLERESCPPGPYVSPFSYRPGASSRKALNIARRVLLPVESDRLDKEAQGAILRWLRDAAGLHLRAVVDAAGKSLHGLFADPGEAVCKELAAVLPALGCDPAMLRPTQITRLPSCRRGEKVQSLLYLDDGHRNGGAR